MTMVSASRVARGGLPGIDCVPEEQGGMRL